MHWRSKAKIQSLIALLPSTLSYPAYYWVQRHFGSLRKVDPRNTFRKVVAAADRVTRAGGSLLDCTIIEIGTGRHLNASVGLWLLGAGKVTTVDRNPYLRPELVREHLEYVREHTQEIRDIFGSRLRRDRLDALLAMTASQWTIDGLMELCAIDYVAPCDATALSLAPGSYDIQLSFNVFEHVPPDVLQAILREGNRVVKPEGLFVHRIDYSDHFSHSDKSISPINFLQFDAAEWDRIAGNRYMYMNRLRVDDFVNMFQNVGHTILLVDSDVDPAVRDLLRKGLITLDPEFAKRSEDVLATTGSWFVTSRAASLAR